MQFEALKVFCDVVRYRSFSQAATANHLTQSAASHIVHQLEQRLRVTLIDRSTRPLQLTAQGQVYYDGCKDLVERYLDLEASLLREQAPLAATVQVAAIYSVGLGDMGQFVERFKEQHPGAEVRVEYLHPDRVYERVRAGTADFGLVSFPGKLRELVVLPWREEEMVVACQPGHLLARLKAVRPEHLAGEKVVCFDRGLGIRREVDRFLKKHGVTVQVAAEFDNIENIKKAVEIGAGLALLPEPTIRREVRAGTLAAVPLRGCRLVRPVSIVYSRQHKPGAAALRFIDLLRNQTEESNGAGCPHPDTRRPASSARGKN